MLEPKGVPLAVIFQAFLTLKTKKIVRFWVDKRLRNGRETAAERQISGQGHGQRFS